MPVIGFNFSSINASTENRKGEASVSINSKPEIENIKKKEIDIPGFSEVLSVEFSFTAQYEPKIGEIEIRGEVLYQSEDAKKILSQWKEKKTVDQKAAVEILNTIFRKCLVRAVAIAEDLRLPPPLTFPLVKGSDSKKDGE